MQRDQTRSTECDVVAPSLRRLCFCRKGGKALSPDISIIPGEGRARHLRNRSQKDLQPWHFLHPHRPFRYPTGQMASQTKLLEEKVAAWPQVTVAPHRFGGREFRFHKAEIGHVHFWGDVDIPFPHAIHDLLLEERLAQRHRWLPDSGWITYRMTGSDGLGHALWLLRLSYLRYALKAAPDPTRTLQEEAERLRLNERLVALLTQFVPQNARSSISTHHAPTSSE
jgi:hypothetical protein